MNVIVIPLRKKTTRIFKAGDELRVEPFEAPVRSEVGLFAMKNFARITGLKADERFTYRELIHRNIELLVRDFLIQ